MGATHYVLALLMRVFAACGGCATGSENVVAMEEGFALPTQGVGPERQKAASGAEAAFRLSLHSSGTNASATEAQHWIAAENGIR